MTPGLHCRRFRAFRVRRWVFRWGRVCRRFRVFRVRRWVFRWGRVCRRFRVFRVRRWVFRWGRVCRRFRVFRVRRSLATLVLRRRPDCREPGHPLRLRVVPWRLAGAEPRASRSLLPQAIWRRRLKGARVLRW
ncbi:hypothetical protein GR927_36120 [Mycolicibacterium sp. 3033]|nr:hypothetical protein [Mycolicibacterium aurantiacum]